MYSRPALQDAPTAARCEVFAATALRVRTGVNAGDDLGSPDAPCAGDIYRLQAEAQPALLRLTTPGPDGLRRIGPGSQIGRAGHAVAVEARLLLMATDGVRAEVLVLRPDLPDGVTPQRLLLPLQPLIPGVDHTLIQVEAAPAFCCLPDLACGAIGRGSRIMLASGAPRRVEALCPGDMVLTRDHGAQPLRWARPMTLRAAGAHAPVAIARGALGNSDELRLGQHSRLFLYRHADFASTEALVPARHLLDKPGIRLHEGGFADYVVLIFDAHEIIYAEGLAVESLHVTPALTDRLPTPLAQDIRDRFPGLDQPGHFGVNAERSSARQTRQAPVA